MAVARSKRYTPPSPMSARRADVALNKRLGLGAGNLRTSTYAQGRIATAARSAENAAVVEKRVAMRPTRMAGINAAKAQQMARAASVSRTATQEAAIDLSRNVSRATTAVTASSSAAATAASVARGAGNYRSKIKTALMGKSTAKTVAEGARPAASTLRFEGARKAAGYMIDHPFKGGAMGLAALGAASFVAGRSRRGPGVSRTSGRPTGMYKY